MHMCVYVCINMFVCIYIHIYTYLYKYMFILVYTFMHMSVFCKAPLIGPGVVTRPGGAAEQQRGLGALELLPGTSNPATRSWWIQGRNSVGFQGLTKD